MYKKYFFSLLLFGLTFAAHSQYQLTAEPANGNFDNNITLVFEDFDPVNDFYTENQTTIYMYAGVQIDGNGFQYVVGDFNDLSTLGQAQLEDGKFKITFTPSNYFSVPEATQVEGINLVFQNQFGGGGNNQTSDLFVSLQNNQTSDYRVWFEGNPSANETFDLYFQNYDEINNFYTDSQTEIYFYSGVNKAGANWQNIPGDINDTATLLAFQRIDYDGSDPTVSGQVFKAAIQPSVYYNLQDGDMVSGLNLLFLNQFGPGGNNQTVDLYLNLADTSVSADPIVVVTPEIPTEDEQVTITLYSERTPLAGNDNVYFHSGISTDPNSPTNFDIVVGNWGQDDGVGQMQQIDDDVWQIVLPSIRSYYGLGVEDDAFGLNFLFRSADGSIKEENGGSNYFNEIDSGDFIRLVSPGSTSALGEVGSTLEIKAEASAAANWTLWETDAEGEIISELSTATTTALFNYSHAVSDTQTRYFHLQADFGTETKNLYFNIAGYNTPQQLPRPEGTSVGINYFPNDPTRAVLVLHTPTTTRLLKGTGLQVGTIETQAKEVVHLIGDFNDWQITDQYQLNKDGDYWWIELTNLDPDTEYLFQYLVEGYIRMADPYSEKISDPDDAAIEAYRFPNLISYPDGNTSKRVSVLKTVTEEYQWQITDFERPDKTDLNIYEMHFRDFTEEGTYLAAIDRLDYLKSLGINCIHTMPVSEFEGNSSWGYNPNFYFAPDKYYGTSNNLKKFIDEAHKRGMAVVNDLVLNHSFKSNVHVRLYSDDAQAAAPHPTTENPWFNNDYKAIYNTAGHWGADWNHESEHTQKIMDSIINYWISEYKYDGYRFDFTKGISQSEPDPADDWASSYEQDRVDLLTRMIDKMWDTHPGSYAIFEHLAEDAEDKVLADYGILMWSGAGPQRPYIDLALGYDSPAKNYSMWNSVYASRGFNDPHYISYIESHDEQRLGYEVFSYGKGIAELEGEEQVDAAIERIKLVSAFNVLLPGPRMIWQFEELGYDVDINFNGRTGEKPVRWEYFDDIHRKELYDLYATLFTLRNEVDLYEAIPDYGNIDDPGNFTSPRRMTLNAEDGKYVIVLGNFDPDQAQSVQPAYPETGTWYRTSSDPDLDDTSFEVTDTQSNYQLQASELLILSNFIIQDPNIVPAKPNQLVANTAGSNAIDIEITANDENDLILLAFNTANEFGIPVEGSQAGDTLDGGGEILYIGEAPGYTQHSGLNENTTYYYKAWSLRNHTYSTDGITANATTLVSLDMTFETSEASCYDAADGSVTITASGGLPPYIFEVEGVGTSENPFFEGLTSGTYQATLTDSLGNNYSDTFDILAPNALEFEVIKENFGSGCYKLNASGITGGTGAYSYSWSTGDTAEEIIVCPSETTTYNLTLADENNCSATREIEIIIETPVSCGPGNRVLVCHRGRTLCVSARSLEAHLAHGDQLGACENNEEETLFNGYAVPNPVRNYTILKFSATQAIPYQISILNIQGQEMYNQSGTTRQGSNGVRLFLGNYQSGIYFARITAADGDSLVIKIVKR